MTIIIFPAQSARRAPGQLTRLQLKAQGFINQYVLAHGAWPSMEKLGGHLGIPSRSGVKRIVQQLLAVGAVALPDQTPDSATMWDAIEKWYA
jgi:hypothetical protein